MSQNYEVIILNRCFKGWEKIKDKYVDKGSDGDILLMIPKGAWKDIEDAKTILKFLYKRCK